MFLMCAQDVDVDVCLSSVRLKYPILVDCIINNGFN